ncbi:MAG: Eco57I restriction-modification methylase domain-containing protein [Prolixibacteraceae bacterium]|nr:Eco57I restriction-modification methylase domain-containing protein [Prolixibacteraceae bacterium]
MKTNRNEIELFKANLIGLLDQIDETESEEFHKNLVSDFLKNTWYSATHFINTKGRNDLVIHNALNAGSTVGVVIEAKKPTNKAEMLRTDSINTKAFQELVLYYLRERITAKNLEIKYLVATNIYEWFIFDANLFEKEFAQNKNLIKQFTDFEEGRLSGKTTDFFYKQIAEPAIEAIKHEVTFTHFDIRDYDKPLRNADKKDDNLLIALYKLLSPEHLLKLPFVNDSNSLDKTFYAELLHIIGLTETKEGSKKLIQRKKEGERNAASLIESAIFQLDNLDKISRLDKPSQFGGSNAERLFNVALELSITWINRILFLKLLEAQLIKYHKGDQSFAFLNCEKVQNFDDLNNLFFSVLARKEADRNEEVKKQFANVPYLNSSLFEPTGIEHACLFISQLKDMKLPLLSSTVIKNNNGQKRSGELLTIEYIFEFLNAYDFASEGSEEIQEENKRLINASVLGLIFEKINGYKDGSFFTPGFITMYMCRETIRRAVVQKFNEAGANLQGFQNLEGLDDIYNSIGQHFTKDQANDLINSLKICDPAVGSGHFLVSALNEMIAIKSELKILRDREGKTLRDYHVTVENDELIVTDDDGGLFEYNPKSRESQRIQETLFHEKQTIIENCLFGVDINPNSVKICRLRLWIELLKNAYYKSIPEILPGTPVQTLRATSLPSQFPELETLPNIDINIKCGNSLISRYALDADIKKALKSSKWTIDSYRLAVMTYRNAQSKEEKREMEKLIAQIKNDFESDVAANDKRVLKLNKAKGELFALTTQTTLFDRTKSEKAIWDKQVKALTDTIFSIETELEGIRSNKIYENAFEWRFEFPEVLNEEGDFVGFDVVIGNPPYILSRETFSDSYKEYFYSNYFLIHEKPNLFLIFIERGFKLLNNIGKFSFIIPNSWTGMESAYKVREHLLKNSKIVRILNLLGETFEDVNVEASILIFDRNISASEKTKYGSGISKITNFEELTDVEQSIWLANRNFIIDITSSNAESILLEKIKGNSVPLENYYNVRVGLQAYEQGKGIPKQTAEDVKNHIYDYTYMFDDSTFKYLGGADVKRYCIVWSGQWLRYGQWLSQPKSFDQFSEPRILIREITSKYPHVIEACYIKEVFLNNKSILNIIKKTDDVDLFSLLGYLNSKLISFYHIRQTVKGNRNLFPKLVIKDLKNYPVLVNEFYLKISPLAKMIYDSKNVNQQSDTTALESEIDRLVYQLYGLTDEEIKIVEGS